MISVLTQRRTWLVVMLALLAHLMLWLNLPLIWRGGALLWLCGLLPGWLLVDWLLVDQVSQHDFRTVGQDRAKPVAPFAAGDANVEAGRETRPIITAGKETRPIIYVVFERLLYSVVAGYGLIIVVMLLLSYLPGPILFWHPLLAFDVLILLLLWGTQAPTYLGTAKGPLAAQNRKPGRHLWWLGVGLCALALVGGVMRFPNLAYSEFQGDEARVMLRSVQAIQGDPNALLGHLKAPAEILLPTLTYVVTNQIDEATARLPFALANFMALFALFLLGHRLFGALAGWTAAMLLALDGYFIGFAHIVQYQSIVFLSVVTAVLLMMQLRRLAHGADFIGEKAPPHLRNLLTFTAFVVATGLLAHYEAALVLLPLCYLLYIIWREGMPLSSLLRLAWIPLLVGAVLVGSFYVPFVLNPSFGVTYDYITVNRLGVEEAATRYPFNNLVDVINRSTLYSSSYYLALLAALLLGALLLSMRRARTYTDGSTLRRTALKIGVMFLFLGLLHLLLFGRADPTWLLFSLLLLLGVSMPLVQPEERLVWLWFGIPMILALFFIRTPNTHVYGFFIGWALLAGWTAAQGWRLLRTRLPLNMVATMGGLLAVGVIALFGLYEFNYFVRTDVEMLRTWHQARLAGYPVPYDEPTNLSIFGFPFRNGWKSVGMLYQAGTLRGAFDTNATDAVAQWYTRGSLYCARDERYVIWSQALEPKEAADRAARKAELAQSHDLLGTVTVAGEPRLHIYQAKGAAPAAAPHSWADAQYALLFDQTRTAPDFIASGPSSEAVVRKQITNPRDFAFGNAPDDAPIVLLGYDLTAERSGQSAQVAPGDRVMLTLYWHVRQKVDQDYVVFNQIIDVDDGHKAGQRDGEPVCNTLPTSRWQPGRVIVDRYDIPIAADAPARIYTLLTGMYGRETGERLPIFDADGQSLGNAARLGEITIEN